MRRWRWSWAATPCCWPRPSPGPATRSGWPPPCATPSSPAARPASPAASPAASTPTPPPPTSASPTYDAVVAPLRTLLLRTCVGRPELAEGFRHRFVVAAPDGGDRPTDGGRPRRRGDGGG